MEAQAVAVVPIATSVHVVVSRPEDTKAVERQALGFPGQAQYARHLVGSHRIDSPADYSLGKCYQIAEH